mmetsp:Transcript_7788/g.21870  ORF Transcript_7788/g.21870 Transcript_7788/m.21870 type:complete len:293 (+) Transcript_7788:90-968(+)
MAVPLGNALLVALGLHAVYAGDQMSHPEAIQQKSWVDDAWGQTVSIAQDLQKQTVKTAQDVEEGTTNVVQQVGKGTTEVVGSLTRGGAAVALQSSGYCPGVREAVPDIPPKYAPRFAAAFQASREDPSVSQEACMRVVLEDVHASLRDSIQGGPEGLATLLDQVVSPLSEDILPKVCGPPLMGALRASEPVRRTKPELYRRRLEDVLLKRVLTVGFVRGEVGEYCGGGGVRLYADRDVATPPGPRAPGWRPRTGGAILLGGALAALPVWLAVRRLRTPPPSQAQVAQLEFIE